MRKLNHRVVIALLVSLSSLYRCSITGAVAEDIICLNTQSCK